MTPITQTNANIADQLAALYYSRVITLPHNAAPRKWTLRLDAADEAALEQWVALNGRLEIIADWRNRPFMGMRLEFGAERTEVV